jgi:hypothetical protein
VLGERSPALSSRVALEGVLMLAVHREREGHPGQLIASAGFEALNVKAAKALGQPLCPGGCRGADLVGARARLVVDAAGTIHSLALPPDAPHPFGTLLRALLLHLNLALPEGPSGDSLEWGPNGRAFARYAAGPHGVVRRVRERYEAAWGVPLTAGASGARPPQELRSATEIARDEAGTIRSLNEVEVLRVGERTRPLVASRARFEATLTDVASVPEGLSPPAGQARSLGEHIQDPRLVRRLLVERAEGLTRTRVEEDLRVHAVTRGIPELHRWFWRALALLELDPALADELARIFEETAPHTRGLILDLLAGAGGRRAQSAMRRAIATRAAREDETAFLAHLQRFSFLHRPEPASVATVAAIEAEAQRAGKHELRKAALFTLGNLAGALATGDQAAAAPILRGLRGELTSASTPEWISIFLTALGTAKQSDDDERIAGYAAHRDAEVRRAAARVLADRTSAVCARALWTLAADADAAVQTEALRLLRARRLTSDGLRALEQLVARGVAPSAAGHVVALLSWRDDPAVWQLYRVLLARPELPPHVRSEIQSLMVRAPASPRVER